VVPQPTCSYVLKKDYVVYVGGPDAELVAAHTFDSSEYLLNVLQADETELDLNFTGDVAATISYCVPSHLTAQEIGHCSHDLMQLTGAHITVIDQSSGVDGMWGYRAGNEEVSLSAARKLADAITVAESAVVAGDCHLANIVILEQTGTAPQHPLQVLARAYGIAEEGIAEEPAA
jgi:Fe-S oxidoreductase